MGKEKYKKCTSEDFKADLSELCEYCPLTDLITEGIKAQVVFQAEQQKNILSKQDFNQYLHNEISNATNFMRDVHNLELQNKENKNDPDRRNRIEVYIWNKERAKALSKFILAEDSREPEKTLKSIDHASGVINFTNYIFKQQIEGTLGSSFPFVKEYTNMITKEHTVITSVYCPLFIIKAPFTLLDYSFVKEIFNDLKVSTNLHDTKMAYSTFLSRLMQVAHENINLYKETIKQIEKDRTKNYGLCRMEIGKNWDPKFIRKTYDPNEELDEDIMSFDGDPTIQHLANNQLASYNSVFIDFVDTNINNGEKVEKTGIQAFSWTGKPAQLVALYVALKDHGYIDPGTTENVFTAIFSDLSVVNLHRVTWIKKAQKNKQIAKNAIIALFDILIGKEKIAKVEDRSLLFKTLEACFSDESGKPLSFSYGNARQDKPSNEYHTIETIVSSL